MTMPTKGTPRERAESLALGYIASLTKRGLRVEVRRIGKGRAHKCTITLRGQEVACATATDAPFALLNAWEKLFEQSDAEAVRVIEFARRELPR